MPNSKIQIVIVDDHEMFMESLSTWLNRQPGLCVAGHAHDGEAGLNLCRTLKPQVALVDVSLPKMDGVEMIEQLSKEMPHLHTLVMSAHQDPFTIWRISQCGTQGFIEKNAPLKMFKEAIKLVAFGGCYFSLTFQKIVSDRLDHPDSFARLLSKKEQAILLRVAQGQSEKLIAESLGITETTLAVHRNNIRQKLRVHNDREMISYARKWGVGRNMFSLPHRKTAAAKPATDSEPGNKEVVEPGT
ncbi:MAG: response regulator transcription factor [Verrucomicrobiota bacterium]